MRRLALVLVSLALCASCGGSPPPPAKPTNASNVKSVVPPPTPPPAPLPRAPAPPKISALLYLKEFGGKTPKDVNLWQSQPLHDRLAKLIGPDYAAFVGTPVESPIGIDQEVVYVLGFDKKSGNGIILLVDLNLDVVNAKLLRGKEGTVTEYNDPGPPVRKPKDVQTTLTNFTESHKK